MTRHIATESIAMNRPFRRFGLRPLVLLLVCAAIIMTYALMMNLKGIWTDEGVRLSVINGNQPFLVHQPAAYATWPEVVEASRPLAYQPLYYLIQNTLMRIFRNQSLTFFHLLNLVFLGLCLQGLLVLSRDWRLAPRLFLLCLFSFNAYLFMHVLQIREYIAGVAFYIWSTWLVLELDRRRLERPWMDVGWFAGYGALLTAGFYLQSWVVFPAIGQFIFLALRPAGDRVRFYSHLALSYVIVLSSTLPYLGVNKQKINVGLWARESTSLWSHLSEGFHLVFAGHLANHSWFTEFLFWFWPAVITGGTTLVCNRKCSSLAAEPAGEARRQGALMLLCSGVSLAFQVGYTLKVENLAVWPRYFVIHYFFLMWLIALVVRQLWELRNAAAADGVVRRGSALALGALAIVLTASAVYQTHSYYRNPYLDTGLSPASNWRNLSAQLAGFLRPQDVVAMPDFISRATLTATRPVPQPVLILPELSARDVAAADRLVYFEPGYTRPQRAEVATRMRELGFPAMEEIPALAPDGITVVHDWTFLLFSRP